MAHFNPTRSPRHVLNPESEPTPSTLEAEALPSAETRDPRDPQDRFVTSRDRLAPKRAASSPRSVRDAPATHEPRRLTADLEVRGGLVEPRGPEQRLSLIDVLALESRGRSRTRPEGPELRGAARVESDAVREQVVALAPDGKRDQALAELGQVFAGWLQSPPPSRPPALPPEGHYTLVRLALSPEARPGVRGAGVDVGDGARVLAAEIYLPSGRKPGSARLTVVDAKCERRSVVVGPESFGPRARLFEEISSALDGNEYECDKTMRRDAKGLGDAFWSTWRTTNDSAKEHVDDYAHIYEMFRGAVEALARLGVLPEHGTVLDAGCGHGNLLEGLRLTFPEFTYPELALEGVEYNRDSVNACDEKGRRLGTEHLHVRQGDIRELGRIARDAGVRADVAVSSGVLTRLVLDDQLDAVTGAQEIYRVLNDGGVLLVAGRTECHLNAADFERIGFQVLGTFDPKSDKYFYVLRKDEHALAERLATALEAHPGHLDLGSAAFLGEVDLGPLIERHGPFTSVDLSRTSSPVAISELITRHPDAFAKLERLDLRDTRVHDDAIDRLRELCPRVEIELEGSRTANDFTERVRRALSTSPGHLDLAEPAKALGSVPVDDVLERLERSGHLDKIETADLSGTNVSERGLAALAAHGTVRRLDLSGTKLDETVLVRAARIEGLAHLALDRTRIGAEGLGALEAVTALEQPKLKVSLRDCPELQRDPALAIRALELEISSELASGEVEIDLGSRRLPPSPEQGPSTIERLLDRVASLANAPSLSVKLGGCNVTARDLAPLARLSMPLDLDLGNCDFTDPRDPPRSFRSEEVERGDRKVAEVLKQLPLHSLIVRSTALGRNRSLLLDLFEPDSRARATLSRLHIAGERRHGEALKKRALALGARPDLVVDTEYV